MAQRIKRYCLYALLLWAVASSRAEESADDSVSVEVEDDDQYRSPQIDPESVYLAEHFDDEAAFKKRWVKSEAKKQGVDENIAKYDGKWEIQPPVRRLLRGDRGLVLTTEAKHAAVAALLDRPFVFNDKPLVVQYEVTMQEGQNCGGAYLKLLSKGVDTKADLRKFHDQTPYTIMFGPDKCGNDNKLHFIFRHTNPRNGSVEEKHAKKPTMRLEDLYKDKEPHLYTLIVRPDNTFTVLVDNKEANSGSLLEDVQPPVNPPEEVDDPADARPAHWDEREKIVDPEASKPADWDESQPAQIPDPNAVKPEGWLDDEPEMIPDGEAVKPADWDEEMDGAWEPPLVDNPACGAAPGCGPWRAPLVPNPGYKGIWRAPLIPNPNYKGKWTPRRIPNPDYFRDEHPFKMTPIHAVGFELWSMSPLLLFDNLLVADDPAAAARWAQHTYALKRAKISSDEHSWWGRVVRATNYRPGSWALYALYCATPFAFYVAYLVHRAREESVVERALRFAGENPWVYGALIVGAFVLVGGGAYLCCGPRADPESDPKKTDAVTEDDPPADQGAPRRGKATLEGPADDGQQDLEPDSEPEPEPEHELEPEHETEPEPEPDTTEAAGAGGAGDAQRRRKPRRE